MNQYDRYFDFRMASWNDIDAIMRFIKKYWDADHILANDRSFFEYHYGNLDGGINVFLMCDKAGKIMGMHGFVEYSNRGDLKYISGSIIKVVEHLPIPMCGIELMRRFHYYISPFVEFGCGGNPKTIISIYEKVFRYKVGVMRQHYIINPQMKKFKIITIPKKDTGYEVDFSGPQFRLEKIKDFHEINFDFNIEYANLPIKERSFLEKRYFHHPIFHYDVYRVNNASSDEGILFTRKVNYNGSSIILIVDFVGRLSCLKSIGGELSRILIEEDAECVSLLEAGMPEEFLLQAGFRAVELDQSDVIIPTYFEPFVDCNVTNHYVTVKEDMVIFKATGDQDNPKKSQRLEEG